MTCLQPCVLFNIQIFDTFTPVFMNIFQVEANAVQMRQCFYSAVMTNSKLDFVLVHLTLAGKARQDVLRSNTVRYRYFYDNYRNSRALIG